LDAKDDIFPGPFAARADEGGPADDATVGIEEELKAQGLRASSYAVAKRLSETGCLYRVVAAVGHRGAGVGIVG
jgi:hypothetical protein